MTEMEIIRLMKDLMRLLQNLSELEGGEDGIEERLEEIKSELGSWFIDGYLPYQAS